MSDAAQVEELTPPGRGAVSVLAVRGSAALARLAALAGRGLPPPGEVRLVRLRAGAGGEDELLDLALCVGSAPGEVELHLHGSPPLVRAVRAQLGAGPAPDTAPCGPESLEQRALALLARAPSEAAARILLDQAEGALRAELTRLALVDPPRARAGLAALAARGRVVRCALEPLSVVLAGPVNAGKSTLFNLLVGRERVVVSRAAGTTRDAVRERVTLGEWAVDLIDTAGERELRSDGAAARLERAGQALGRELRAGAALVLWLDPRGRAPSLAPGAARHVVLTSRADELAPGERLRARAPISVQSDPLGARLAVERAVLEALALPARPWQPGRAAPFDRRSRELVARLRRATTRTRSTTARAAALALALRGEPLDRDADAR